MPVITVKMFEGRTRQQREEFTKVVTKAAVDILKTPVEHVWIVFEDRPKSHWAIGGKLCDQ
ncbi:MAG: tautomerase family protein [Candidatus Omnitrophica bacterium]|nr:tautomerase family protein [Candidatus Omnitrophota bacterium]